MEAELEKLEYNLGGVRDMKRLPAGGADHRPEDRGDRGRRGERLGIPIIGLVDSNVDPMGVAFPIPGNDDAIRSCELVISTVGEAVSESANNYREAEAKRRAEEEEKRRREEEESARREEEERARKEAEEAAAAAPGRAAPRRPPPRPPPSSRQQPQQPQPPQQPQRPAVPDHPQAVPPETTELMAVSATDVKALRDRTGAAMMDCKAALEEADGDADKAVELLRVKGQASAAKRSGKATSEGVVSSYIHAGGKVGVLVEVQCETDFVARTDDFQEFAREVAIHIAALNPQYVSTDEIPEDARDAERRVFEEKAREEGKPDNVIERIVEGQLSKWAKDVVLLEQEHVRTDRYEGKTIEQLRADLASKTGENIRIARFARFAVGEE